MARHQERSKRGNATLNEDAYDIALQSLASWWLWRGCHWRGRREGMIDVDGVGAAKKVRRGGRNVGVQLHFSYS